jgi:hypothetical protein
MTERREVRRLIYTGRNPLATVQFLAPKETSQASAHILIISKEWLVKIL